MTRLLTLVEEERLDELLQDVSVYDIAEAWCRYSSAQQTSDRDDEHPDWWAVQLWMSRSWWERRDLVRDGLLALLRCAHDSGVLSHFAAGPLEVFISERDDDLAWIEEQARTSETFRRALAQVWIWDLPDGVVRRIERAARVPLPRPDRQPE